ncbi:MAG: hypothetical protein ACOCVM_01545 [Desulfovibrionaceae bacterium]
MTPDSKYSVLFMRDDSNVKRFRMSPLWLKIFIYFQVFLVAYAVLITFLAVRFLQANTRLTKAKQETETLLADAAVQLERLQKVRHILAAYEAEDVDTLLGVVQPPEQEPADSAAPGQAVSLSRLFDRIDAGQAAVSEFDAQLDGRRLDLSFSLNNLLPSDKTISGRAVVKLVLDDGSQAVLPTNPEEMSYLIQRYKQVHTSAQLPAGVDPGVVIGLRLVLQSSNGNIVLSELHPLGSDEQ